MQDWVFMETIRFQLSVYFHSKMNMSIENIVGPGYQQNRLGVGVNAFVGLPAVGRQVGRVGALIAAVLQVSASCGFAGARRLDAEAFVPLKRK